MQRVCSNKLTGVVYTHQLPYGVRREICNLLDADQSWRLLGGQFLNLDNTRLTLIGQAYLRNGSPTEELLLKLDSANMQISELCVYLKQMNNQRAVQLLERQLAISAQSESNNAQETSHSKTLNTPTPSFTSGPNQNAPALMEFGEPIENMRFDETTGARQPPASGGCHRNGRAPQEANQLDLKATSKVDPGEEIVRLACANNRRRTSISDQEVVNQLRLIMQITYNELKQASNDFADTNILGHGGFASVYRGHWKGTDVAIKRLRCNLMDQALNELTILNSYRIDNILPIYGISIDGPAACLVYQFMANGSLEDRLSCKKGTPPLNWNQRALIGEGVAKGLYYLHTLRDKPLVHGDVKSANVLLDAQFVPKLGDFGLARQVFKGKNPQTEICTHCTVSSIHGTSVYLPAEYLRHKILSSAVDVYSYGIVLLEMATGKRAYDGKRLLIDFIEDELKSQSMERISSTLKDHRLACDSSQMGFKVWYELLIALGLSCAHKIKKKRPDMGQVLNRFASFRENPNSIPASGSQGNGNSNSNNNNSIMLNNLMISNVCQSSTPQTHTPELATLENKQHLFAGNETVSRPNGPKTPIVQPNNNANALRLLQNTPLGLNSALMSVDEEVVGPGGELIDAPEIAAVDGKTSEPKQRPEQEPAPVEAMIPLLTELGIDT